MPYIPIAIYLFHILIIILKSCLVVHFDSSRYQIKNKLYQINVSILKCKQISSRL